MKIAVVSIMFRYILWMKKDLFFIDAIASLLGLFAEIKCIHAVAFCSICLYKA